VISRKRWQNIYTEENPFALPQAVAGALTRCCKGSSGETGDGVKYLWIHLPGTAERTAPVPEEESLTPDEWMCVIDEAASVGVKSIIVSVGSPLQMVPQLVQVCQWAQGEHEMVVGIHAYVALDTADAEVLKKLDARKTRVFADGEHIESARFVEQLGIPLQCADGLHDHEEQPHCDLPSTMTCVGPEGTMYTCGLVLGQEQFSLGHILGRKLTSVITDHSLPHAIPAGASTNTHRCNGCPPLMAKKMQEESV
jgi:radical SAM protein with 4Fe4S-binding SPASM domain